MEYWSSGVMGSGRRFPILHYSITPILHYSLASARCSKHARGFSAMPELHNHFGTLQTLTLAEGKSGRFYSLPQLEKEAVGPVSRLPVSIRVLLESVLRNCDGKRIHESDIRRLANWKPHADRTW